MLETVASGIRTYYIGLDEQTNCQQLLFEYREQLQDLIGKISNPALFSQGVSISRNIAYLYLHAFLREFKEKALIYFLDSDEEFRIKIRRGAGIEI